MESEYNARLDAQEDEIVREEERDTEVKADDAKVEGGEQPETVPVLPQQMAARQPQFEWTDAEDF